MKEIRFDNKTVVVTGAGSELGRAYALFFASRGANVVVNDTQRGGGESGASASTANLVVQEIHQAGGKAIADHHSVQDGQRIIKTAVRSFGTVHILINNAGLRRDSSFAQMDDEDWDEVYKSHTYGACSCAKACWPLFKKQRFGRIINTASTAGINGATNAANFAAQTLGLVGFTYTLAKEGVKYNIGCNCIALPVDASASHHGSMSSMHIVSTVAYLSSMQQSVSGGFYELHGGTICKLRWQRATGVFLKPDVTLTPEAVLAGWSRVTDFSRPSYPTALADTDYVDIARRGQLLGANSQGDAIVTFKDKVVLITGAANGLGRAYARLCAKLGAKLVLNDIHDPASVVNDCRQLGAEAVGCHCSVENGEAIVQVALDKFGAIHVVINNAGILRDKSFLAMSEQEWSSIQAVHMHGAYQVSKAAWPHMLKQRYGRFVNTTSVSGLYGSFGQANYATAKMAIVGFSKALATEGASHNILSNCIAPMAGTDMLRTIMTEEAVSALSPDFVASAVATLASEHATANGQVFETSAGWIALVRWQRSQGYSFPDSKIQMTPEDVADKWSEISDFDNSVTPYPQSSDKAMSSPCAMPYENLVDRKLARSRI